jgi:hypothetical protein
LAVEALGSAEQEHCMGSMEGWLYVIESNRLMMTHPRKRYFVICGNWACFWKDKPANREEVKILCPITGY